MSPPMSPENSAKAEFGLNPVHDCYIFISVNMNRDRRKVIGNIFADAAKYTLTAGVISGILSGKTDMKLYVLTGIAISLFITFAYFITPKDKEDKS